MHAKMDSEEEHDQIFRQLKPQKSVQINEEKTQIIEIREKHGPLYKAIPRMPIAVAVLCCVLNIVIPGLGTFISAFTVFCGAPTGLTKVPAFFFNVLSAFLQMITFIIIVGWVWSILWGMNMVSLAMNWGEDKKVPYYCRRQSSIDVPESMR